MKVDLYKRLKDLVYRNFVREEAVIILKTILEKEKLEEELIKQNVTITYLLHSIEESSRGEQSLQKFQKVKKALIQKEEEDSELKGFEDKYLSLF